MHSTMQTQRCTCEHRVACGPTPLRSNGLACSYPPHSAVMAWIVVTRRSRSTCIQQIQFCRTCFALTLLFMCFGVPVDAYRTQLCVLNALFVVPSLTGYARYIWGKSSCWQARPCAGALWAWISIVACAWLCACPQHSQHRSCVATVSHSEESPKRWWLQWQQQASVAGQSNRSGDKSISPVGSSCSITSCSFSCVRCQV